MLKRFGKAQQQGFSSILVKYDQSYSYHRYFADPFKRILFSTKGAEFDAVEACLAEGMSIEDAVFSVLEQQQGDKQ